MKILTLEEARRVRALRAATRVVGAPLRFAPVIVPAPEAGFVVVELGFAVVNELEIVA